MVMRRGDDADFKDKISKKNKELSEYLDEIRVWLTVWDVMENAVLILCLSWITVWHDSVRLLKMVTKKLT